MRRFSREVTPRSTECLEGMWELNRKESFSPILPLLWIRKRETIRGILEESEAERKISSRLDMGRASEVGVWKRHTLRGMRSL